MSTLPEGSYVFYKADVPQIDNMLPDGCFCEAAVDVCISDVSEGQSFRSATHSPDIHFCNPSTQGGSTLPKK